MDKSFQEYFIPPEMLIPIPILFSMGFSRQEYWSGVPLPSPNRAWAHIIFELKQKLEPYLVCNAQCNI